VDTGHMHFAGGNSIKLVEDFIDRIIHVHCKDIRKDVLEKSLKNDSTFRQAFLDGAFTVPGDGCIDYKPFLAILKNKNYVGWLVVEAEQDPAKANPFEYAKIGFNYLSKTAKECGFKIIS
jgi:inosose dehydratase